jgi:hypothetical protein
MWLWRQPYYAVLTEARCTIIGFIILSLTLATWPLLSRHHVCDGSSLDREECVSRSSEVEMLTKLQGRIKQACFEYRYARPVTSSSGRKPVLYLQIASKHSDEVLHMITGQEAVSFIRASGFRGARSRCFEATPGFWGSFRNPSDWGEPEGQGQDWQCSSSEACV